MTVTRQARDGHAPGLPAGRKKGKDEGREGGREEKGRRERSREERESGAWRSFRRMTVTRQAREGHAPGA